MRNSLVMEMVELAKGQISLERRQGSFTATLSLFVRGE
jgi:hypothetical protein